MKKLSFVVMFLLLCMAGSSYADDTYHFASTDMTWAEFYAGELDSSSSDLAVSYDAVSTATKRFITRFNGFTSATSGDGSVFYGVKAVRVRMTEDVYNLLSKDSRYSFDTATFTEYKDVSSDGSFGKMVTASIDANAKLSGLSVSLAGGKSNGHGNYRLNISGFKYASLDVTTGTSYDKFLGATLETSDGKVYGMKPLHNLWVRGDLAEQIGFSIKDFAEGNGTHLSYQHTADLSGKTIKKITLMLRDQPDPVISCDVYVKRWTDAAITASIADTEIAAGNDVKVTITSSDLPASYTPYLLKTGSRIDRGTETAFTYSDGVLTISSKDVVGGQYTVAFKSDNYVDITATFTVNLAHYATTDMTWAEFYAGEVGSTAAKLSDDGYDAVSTATTNFINRMVQLVAESDDDGTTYSGVKAVQVRMTDGVYQALSSDSRYTFSSTGFDEYKEVSSDGSFGKMITESIDASSSFDVKVSAYNGYHTQYTLSITGPSLASLDLKIASGEGRTSTFNYYLGGTMTTTDNKVYGLKHLSNLWVSINEMGFAVSDYLTERVNHQSYKHTSDLQGKTIKQIRFMIKDQPDLVINCSVPVKYLTTATAAASEPSEGWLVSSGVVSIPITLTGTASDASYTLSEVATVEGRAATPLDTSKYSYSNGVLSLTAPDTGSYRATFTSSKYSDISVSFTLYTTDATSKIISPDTNNAGGVSFLLTPKGAVEAVDEFMNSSSYVNADEYTSPDKNYSATYNPSGAVVNSGFSFDITLNGVPSGKNGVVGVGKMFYLTPDSNSAGSLFANILDTISNDIPVGESGYHEIHDGKTFRDMGLRVVSIYGEGLSRDVTDYVGAGAMITDSTHIMLFYGIMLVDRAITTSDEGKTYPFSPEGETLISDGVKDDHLKAAWYFERVEGSNTTPVTPNTPSTPSTTTRTYTPSSPSVSGLNASTSRDAILTSLRNTVQSQNSQVSIPENVTVVEGYTSYMTGGTSSVTVPASALNADDEKVSFVLGNLTFTQPTVVLFGAQLSDDATPGYDLNWKLIDGSVTSPFVDAAENGSVATFYDGEEVTTQVPNSRKVNVSAYFQAGEYSPVITTSKHYEGPGDNSSGCNVADSFVPMIMLATLLVFRRK